MAAGCAPTKGSCSKLSCWKALAVYSWEAGLEMIVEMPKTPSAVWRLQAAFWLLRLLFLGLQCGCYGICGARLAVAAGVGTRESSEQLHSTGSVRCTLALLSRSAETRCVEPRQCVWL
eukprot:4659071-Pleurochrysis_carterae.AAC.2